MNFGQIRQFDVANGPGIRTSIFVTGCYFNCPGCFNQQFKDFNSGTKWSKQIEDKIISFLQNEHVCGLSVLGGEPLSQDGDLFNLLRNCKLKINKSIWMWTGFCFENLNNLQKELLQFVDVLVDGPFIETKKNLKLKFRGSSNQRIIDVKLSFKYGKIVQINDDRVELY